MSVTVLLVLTLTLPLAGAILIAMSDGKPNQRETVTLVTAGALFAAVVALTPRVISGRAPLSGAIGHTAGRGARLSC